MMRKFVALREDLIKHLVVGIVLGFFLNFVFQELNIFSPVVRCVLMPVFVGIIAYLEEFRQATTANRTPAHDDSLITVSGGVIGNALYVGLISLT